MTEQLRERHGDGWNVLVTAQEGAARDLKRLVNRHGTFRWSPFRNVLLGHVSDPQAFFQLLLADFEQKPFANRWLGKALPIVVTFPVRPESFLQDVQEHLGALIDALQGKTFHVRVERRGHKGELRTHELERHLGDFVWEQLQKRGEQPSVSFKDPDVVIAIEITGQTAGIAVVPRELRRAFAFVKID